MSSTGLLVEMTQYKEALVGLYGEISRLLDFWVVPKDHYLQVEDEVRATLLGVKSRDTGMFNSPSMYASVSKAFDWIKETIGKEMGEDQACPLDLKDNWDRKGSDYQELMPAEGMDDDKEEQRHYLVETVNNPSQGL